ncbi:MAG: hypothetical protein SNH79_07470, partial [Rikenellaceae bacterium]
NQSISQSVNQSISQSVNQSGLTATYPLNLADCRPIQQKRKAAQSCEVALSVDFGRNPEGQCALRIALYLPKRKWQGMSGAAAKCS